MAFGGARDPDPQGTAVVVAHAAGDDLFDPEGRVRLERVDSSAVVDYAAYADCVLLEVPGGGLNALESLRASTVPAVLYDRTADPAVAAEATRLGVCEYVTPRALRGQSLTDLIVEVVERNRRTAEEESLPPSTDLEGARDRRSALPETERDPDEASPSRETVERLLETGCECFGLDLGAFAVTDGETYTVVAGDEDVRGTTIPFSKTICRTTVRTDAPLELPDTAWGPPADDLTEPFTTLGSYIGDGLALEDGWYGTIWFGSERVRSSFSPDERALFRLFVRLLRAGSAVTEVLEDVPAGAPSWNGGSLASDGSGDVLTDDASPLPRASVGSDGVDGAARTLLSLLSAEPATADGTDELANRRFRHFFDRLPDPVVDIEFRDGTPIVRGINDAFEAQFGHEESSAAGRPLADLIVPEDRSADTERLEEHAIRRGYGTAEVERQTVDGRRTFLFRGFSYRQDADDIKYGFGIYTDITDQLEQKRRLRVLHRVLRHNLRNEMTVIIGYADMLAEEGENPEYRALAERIYEEAIDVSKLGEQVRRIEQALDVDRQQVALDPEPLARSIADEFRDRHPAATIRVAVGESVEVIADELLETAIGNLLENAIEHHPDVPTVDVELVPADEEYFDITVRDDGPGIPERERAIVGGDREITQLDHSRGLGLWVSQWVARGVGGQLLFGDCETGAEVTLRLRRADGRTSE